MILFSHVWLLRISGMLWFGSGVLLLSKGLRFLEGTELLPDSSTPIVSMLAPYAGDRSAALLLLVAFSLGLGYLKTRFVLRRVVERTVGVLKEASDPAPLSTVFNYRFLLLFLGAGCVGFVVNNMNITFDVRGFIDTAVGAALVNSSIIYFRSSRGSSAI